MKKSTFRSVLFILVIVFMVYGLFIPYLGFYHDDFLLLAAKVNNQDISFLFSVDRPLVGIFHAKMYQLFANNPLYYHGAFFLIHLLCCIMFFYIIKKILPENKSFIICSSIIFAVYPGFLIYVKALTYLPHITSLLIGLLSILLLLEALSLCLLPKPKKGIAILYSLLASGLNFLYMGLVEYAFGLEVVKILLLIYYYYHNNKHQFKLRHTIYIYIPSLITTILFLYWRLVIFQPKRIAVDQSLVINDFLSSPLNKTWSYLKYIFSSFLHSTSYSYFLNAYNYLFESNSISNIIAIFISLLVILIFILFIKSQKKYKLDYLKPKVSENLKTLFIFSFIMIIFSILPVVFTNRYVDVTTDFNRYSLQVIPAISIFLTCLISYLKNWKSRIILTSLIIFTSVFTHISNQYQYINKWDLQNTVWNQITWRVPQFKDDSIIMIELPDGYKYAENFEIFAPLNQIYNSQNDGNMRLVAEILNNDTITNIKNRTQYEKYTRTIPITYDFNNVVVFSMPSIDSCVHLMNPAMPIISEFENDSVLEILENSNPNLIDLEKDFLTITALPFYQQTGESWCYYFEQGSFFAQREEWGKVISIGLYTIDNNIVPADISEYLPFLAAFYSRENYESYYDFLLEELKSNTAFVDKYCEYSKPNMDSMNERFIQITNSLCGQF